MTALPQRVPPSFIVFISAHLLVRIRIAVHLIIISRDERRYFVTLVRVFPDLSPSVETKLAVGPGPVGPDGTVRVPRQSVGVFRRPRHDQVQIGIRRAQRSRRRDDMGAGLGRFQVSVLRTARARQSSAQNCLIYPREDFIFIIINPYGFKLDGIDGFISGPR